MESHLSDESGGVDELVRSAQEHLQAGNINEASLLCRQALEKDPASAEALHILAAIEARSGRVDSAIAYLQQVVDARPWNPKYQNSLGAAYAQNRQLAHAIHHFSRAVASQRRYRPALRNLSHALREVGYLAESARIDEFVRALDPDQPDSPDALCRLGIKHYDADEFAEAAAWLRSAVEAKPDFVEARKYLVDALWEDGHTDEALVACQEMLEKLPDEPETLRSYGLLLQRTGHIEEAKTYLAKSIEANPEFIEPYLTYTECKRFEPGDSDIGRMESLLAKESLSNKDEVILHYALGKVYSDLKDYDAAFESYRRGADLKRQDVEYDASEMVERMDTLIDFFDEERFAKIGDRFARYSRVPIFIVGMPRAGTTLVEQIVASHPIVYGAGELNDVRRITQRMPAMVQRNTPFPECLDELVPTVGRRLATDYLDRLATLGPDASHVTDKMPWNFHALGVIAMLWPRAKILYCVRDPMDTCVSCYTRYFSGGQPFSWDQVELGHYYRQQQRLAEHWRAVLPMPMFTVQYERLIAEQEKVTREILEFCELDWDDRCLAFHETKRAIMTNPIAVREPIYNKAVGRWKRFESHLEPLQQALAGEIEPAEEIEPGEME